MANEIRASGTLTITKNGFTVTGNIAQTVSMTGSNYAGNIMEISTSYVEIPTGSCSDLRYIFISNESSASVNVAVNSASQSFANLRWNDLLMLPPPTTQGTYFIKSDTAATQVQVVIVES